MDADGKEWGGILDDPAALLHIVHLFVRCGFRIQSVIGGASHDSGNLVVGECGIKFLCNFQVDLFFQGIVDPNFSGIIPGHARHL